MGVVGGSRVLARGCYDPTTSATPSRLVDNDCPNDLACNAERWSDEPFECRLTELYVHSNARG